MIRQNVEQEDVQGVANHTRYAVAICAPYVKDRAKYKMPSMDSDESVIFAKCMEIIEELLIEMSDRGIYAWKEEPLGDGTGLALRDE